MSNRASERLLSGRAWDDFCEVIRLAGHTLERWQLEPDELERAEWYRFLTRLLRNGLERFVENREPYRPRLRDASWRSSINVQSPDQDHLMCELDAARDLRITGQRGGAPYFVIAAWSAPQPADPGAQDWAARGLDGLKEFDPATLRTTAFLASLDMHFEPDGSFQVVLSQQPQPGNWLKLEPDNVGVLIRVVYHDRAREAPPSLRVERLDGELPRPVRPQEVGAGLALAAQEVLGYAELVRSWWEDNLSHRPNRLRYSQATYLSNGGVADRHFAFGTWEKGPQEALVIRFAPPECEHWIFQLCNVWQENLDCYEEGQGRVSKHTARYEPDGSVRLVIAEHDPGTGGNWVDSYGHVRGLMGLRLIRTRQPPPVELYRLPLERLVGRGWAALEGETPLRSGEVTP
jgi:hypothetical protein